MNKKIADSYKQVVKEREGVFKKTINRLIALKTIRKEELPNEYSQLYTRLHIVSDFYLSSVGVFEKKESKDKLLQHKRVFFKGLYPYLTNAGKKEYQSLMKP